MVQPFAAGNLLQQACPMSDIFAELASQLGELKILKENAAFEMAPS
jgi:adenylate cyclase